MTDCSADYGLLVRPGRVITESERRQEARKIMSRCDKDGNGMIDEATPLSIHAAFETWFGNALHCHRRESS